MSLTFKRNVYLIVILVAVVSLLTLTLGNRRVIAYTSSNSAVSKATTNDINNDTYLFDPAVLHEIQLLMADADYQQMITTYQQTGEKEYFHADVIIDGVRINNVGVRLKGNASLMTALGRGGMAAANRQPAAGRGQINPGELPNFPEGGIQNRRGNRQIPEGMTIPTPSAGEQLPQGGDRQLPQEGNLPAIPGGGQFPGGDGGQVPTDRMNVPGFQQPTGDAKIPLLIKFDEFVSGQTYQGYSRLAIRTYGTSTDAAMLQEPLTNDAARAVGLTVTETAYTSFCLNDQPCALYTLAEVIDQAYIDKHFPDSTGVLYKADVGTEMKYLGEDPTLYTQDFSQETRVNDADMAPLIAFIRFLSTATEEEFEQQLPDYLDIDAFATYLAVNNLLVNADSIFGMGNNFYLYYDEGTQRFTLLMWDANESLGKLGMGAVSVAYDLNFSSSTSAPMRMGSSNVLFERFIANPTFFALYRQKLAAVYETLFATDYLLARIDQISAMILAANSTLSLVDATSYTTAVEQVQNFIILRGEYVRSTDLIP